MTQDEIIEMARQAHLGVTLTHSGEVGQFIEGSNWTEEIEAFAKLVEDAAFKRWAAQTKLAVQDEREACAKVCEQQEDYGPLCETIWGCAAAIRART